MLRSYSNSRTYEENLRLGIFTAIVAGMVNVASFVLFYSFTSNLTGHYAILAQEIADGKWFQVLVVLFWIILFFAGSFLSNNIIINGNKKKPFLAHSIPMILEICCFIVVGIYGQYFYKETLTETEVLVSILLFSMGLQNGMTASLSNFQVKTTHLTGLTTDLALHISMLTKKKYRRNKQVVEKTKLLTAIMFSYLIGGVVSGLVINYFDFKVFYVISAAMAVVIIYDYVKTHVSIFQGTKKATLGIQQGVKQIKDVVSKTQEKPKNIASESK